MSRVIVAVVLVVGLAGCAGEDRPACGEVPAEVVASIAGGDSPSIETTGRAATTPTDEGHLVAVEFVAGGEPATGVWWTNSLAGDGMVSAVDHLAQSFTDWPAGPLSPGDRRVSEVAECVTG